jgi:hypothetical protein
MAQILPLWFAKDASGAMSLRGNAFITVMQAPELRDLDDPSDPRDVTIEWALLAEAQMGPGFVVVAKYGSVAGFVGERYGATSPS